MAVRIIANQKERAAEWARTAHPGHGLGEWDKFTALLLEKDLEIKAAVFYTNWHPKVSIDINVAASIGENWLTRPFLRAAFRYPFLELGVRRIGALVAANNHTSLRFVRHIGFTQEGIAREGWDGGIDLICFGLLKSECKYLTGPVPQVWSVPNEQRITSNTARSRDDHSRPIRCEHPVRHTERRA